MGGQAGSAGADRLLGFRVTPQTLPAAAPLAVACASKAFLLAVAPVASAMENAPNAFLSSGSVYDVNFYG